MIRICLFLLFGALIPFAHPAWGKSCSGNVTVEVNLSAREPGKEAKLWLPYPVSDENQLISDISIKGNFTDSAVYTDRKYGTPILFARWDAKSVSRRLTFSFHAERKEVIRRSFPKKEAAWDPADYREYLEPNRLGPIDGKVRALAARIVAGRETVQDKARAIYDWTCVNMYRDPETTGCGKGDVCRLLRKPGGKCVDISSVFIALCRAAGVPAREIFGIRLGKKAQEDITTWQHCWAQFYLPGYGWVPVDPADVRKAMLVEKLGPKDPKTAAYESYFWGGIDPYRIRIAEGRDIMLNPPQSGAPLNTFGYPYAEIGGKAIDFYAPKSFVYSIKYSEK